MLTHMYACTNTHGHTPMFSRFFFCILATRHGLEMRTVTCSPRLTLPDICLIRKTLHRSLTRKKKQNKKQRKTQAWAGSKLYSSISQGLRASLQGHHFCLMCVVGHKCQQYSELTPQARVLEPTAELVFVQTEVITAFIAPPPCCLFALG